MSYFVKNKKIKKKIELAIQSWWLKTKKNPHSSTTCLCTSEEMNFHQY